MDQIARVTVAVSPEMQGQMQKAVESGRYASISEVMREGLRLWQRQELLYQEDVNRLRKLWDEGIESGNGGEWNENTLEESKARFRSHRGIARAAE